MSTSQSYVSSSLFALFFLFFLSLVLWRNFIVKCRDGVEITNILTGERLKIFPYVTVAGLKQIDGISASSPRGFLLLKGMSTPLSLSGFPLMFFAVSRNLCPVAWHSVSLCFFQCCFLPAAGKASCFCQLFL